MAKREKISKAQADRITKILAENYQLRSAGSAGFWLLKTKSRN